MEFRQDIPIPTPKKRLWNNLLEERELIHFFTDEELRNEGVDQKSIDQANYVKVAGILDQADHFDYPFFGYTLDEAKVLNPQSRMMHQLTWEALEDAACQVDRYRKKIGIFLGANRDINWELYTTLTNEFQVDHLLKGKMANPNFMASLISYKLNLRGPCYFIDTACSTSLSATHLACRSLLLSECGIAVVGGVRMLSREDHGYIHHEGSILSNDGHNRTFDKGSTGTIGADGAGVVVLKRLEEALNDNDHIYAVIKGSAMNNDGSAKAGYTMPSIEGQVECIRLAQKIAGVAPEEISYIEAHGTGTRIGDPIEIASLNKAFGYETGNRCAIGSIKSNMGHTDEAAGISGLIKTALCLKHRMLPASIHFEAPNPTIGFDEGPFYVNDHTRKWTLDNDKPLIAGINSLGIGGTNVHMILKEPPSVATQQEEHAPRLIRYAARSKKALERYESKLMTYIETYKDIRLVDLAYTLQVGRKPMDYCRYVVVDNMEKLSTYLKSEKKSPKPIASKRHITFMFSGQGSQYVQMGRGLYKAFPVFKNILDEGFNLLENSTGTDYSSILFSSDDEQAINNTQYTQPILFLFEYALAKLLMDLGIHPKYMIGHSLGEYVAATISGVWRFEDALTIVAKRGMLMAQMEAGDMLSVRTSINNVPTEILDNVSIAAENTKDSFVVSGTKEAIASVMNYFKANDIACIPLQTSHAFHSGMMYPMLKAFRTTLESVTFNTPTIPFVSNTTGEFILDTEATAIDYWLNHVVDTVRLNKGIKTIVGKDHQLIIEVGPGRALSTFCKSEFSDQTDSAVITTIRHVKQNMDDEVFFNEFLGNVWCHGFDIDWDKYYGPSLPHKIPLPTYAFDLYPILHKVDLHKKIKTQGASLHDHKDISESLFVPSYKYAPRITKSETPTTGKQKYLIFTDGSAFCEQLIKKVNQEEHAVVQVGQGAHFLVKEDGHIEINASDHESYQKLFSHLEAIAFDFDFLIYGWGLDEKVPSHEDIDYKDYLKHYHHSLHIIKILGAKQTKTNFRWVSLSHQGTAINGMEHCWHASFYMGAWLQVVVQENEDIRATLIDVDKENHTDRDVEAVLKELEVDEPFYALAIKNGKRWVTHYEPVPLESKEHVSHALRKNGVYLITGDPDETIYTLSEHLLKKYEATVILVPVNDQPSGKQNGHEASQVRDLARLPGHFVSSNVAITDFANFSSFVHTIETEYGKINGVIHMAKNNMAHELSFAQDITPTMIDRHFEPRVNGVLHIHRLFKNRSIDFIKVVSSLSSELGGITYGAYATAAELMNRMVMKLRVEDPRWSVLNLDRIHHDHPFITPEEFIEAFYISFVSEEIEHLIVSKRAINDPSTFISKETKNADEKLVLDRDQINTTFQAPKNELEALIITMIEELFGMEGVGVDDDFFDLGGDSLKALVLINRLKKSNRIELSIAELFSHTTARDIASLIEEKQWLQEDAQKANELLI